MGGKQQQLTEGEDSKRVCFCGDVCEAHGRVHVHDHLPSGLVALAVVGSFLFLLQHPVTGGAVLQGKLAEDLTKPVDADVSHAVGRMTEVQQEGVEPGGRSGRWRVLGERLEAGPSADL